MTPRLKLQNVPYAFSSATSVNRTNNSCQEGESVCGTVCANLKTDKNNCGGCANACDSCVDGSCVSAGTGGGDVCQDDLLFLFPAFNDLPQDCGHLTRRPERSAQRLEKYCSDVAENLIDGKLIRDACQSSCDACPTLVGPTATTSRPAQLTTTIGYPGFLSTSTGSPVTTTVDITFKLYVSQTVVEASWSETYQAVSIKNGHFEVELGSVGGIPVELFNAPLFLGVSIGEDAEMAPRVKLTSTPFAFTRTTCPEDDSDCINQ